jgi:GNAT superfamily N-acetyltransferase
MQTPHEAPPIERAAEAQLADLIEIMSDSFAADPVMNWVMPNPAVYPAFFRLIISEIFLPRGLCHWHTESRGASLWLPPGVAFDIPPRLSLFYVMARLVLRRGPEVLRRLREQGQVFARHHPKEPHYHLQFVGCRSRDQGKGIGSALLKQGTRECDQAGMPAFLESSNEVNVPLYLRHGFEITAEQALPRGGPTVWFMWREPR